MKVLKLFALVALSLAIVTGCNNEPDYDDCVKTATKWFEKNDMPKEAIRQNVELTCSFCKNDREACKLVEETLK